MTAKADETVNAFRVLSEELTPDEREVLLQPNFTELTLAIMNLRTVHGIEIGAIAPGKLSMNSSEHSLETLSETVPGSQVRSIKLNINGRYITYQSFREYLAELEKFPVAIVSLNMREDTFELGIRVYGNTK